MSNLNGHCVSQWSAIRAGCLKISVRKEHRLKWEHFSVSSLEKNCLHLINNFMTLGCWCDRWRRKCYHSESPACFALWEEYEMYNCVSSVCIKINGLLMVFVTQLQLFYQKTNNSETCWFSCLETRRGFMSTLSLSTMSGMTVCLY